MPKETLPPRDSYVPAMDTLSTVGWRAANLVTTIVATSATVALVYNPLSVLMANQLLHGRFFPAEVARAGWYAAICSLLNGVVPALAGSGARTAYTTGVTNSRKSAHGEEFGIDEGAHPKLPESTKSSKSPSIGFFAHLKDVGISAVGDVLVKQPFEIKAQLQRLSVNTTGFTWRSAHNVYKLVTTGAGAQLGASWLNFYGLFAIEPYIASKIPGSDSPGKHLISGTVTGMLTAALSYPFSYYRDLVLKDAAIIEGKLITPGFATLSSQAYKYVQNVGIHKAARTAAATAKTQVPLKMLRSGGVFGAVCSVGAACGSAPLDDMARYLHRFFNKRQDPLAATVEADKAPRSPFQ